ncbi:ADP-ribosylation factor GTPase-activating protein 3 isoform X2 [Monodelphis domestica]|uniref:ADP-ribosylation factor GTPase-activating protein 3 isoform X2 n=1 Tax=Monodelphis domestica TaxID=13616 RepID=UPI0024E23BDB|nr:ADP-ribosylation factor GTPase-activating protein 3 isoform X2 [Monodelphis domestica]
MRRVTVGGGKSPSFRASLWTPFRPRGDHQSSFTSTVFGQSLLQDLLCHCFSSDGLGLSGSQRLSESGLGNKVRWEQTQPGKGPGLSLGLGCAEAGLPNGQRGRSAGGPEQGPSVDGLSISPKASLDVSSLIKKKPTQAKKGLGGKKGGLGAQKVSATSFSDIEKQAQAVEKRKEQDELQASREEPIVSSLRLAYKDLEIQMKKDEKMNFGGKKKIESERLGMGFGNTRSGISHSVTSDMQTIEQETPTPAKPRKKYGDDKEDSYFTSSSARYFEDPAETRSSSIIKWDDSSDLFWKNEPFRDTETILSPKGMGYADRPTSRRKPDYEPAGNTDEAQKKFGNVKAISSDMYFGRQEQADYETRARLERLSGSSSISSADLFDEQRKQSSGNYNLSNVLPNAPDITQFKQGVRSVAGKLSVLANGVMTSIQDRYGS